MAVEIHETALVDPRAELGENVRIGPYCIIDKDVEIGDGCSIEAYAQIKRYATLGPNNHVHSYAYIGNVPQHLGFKGEETWVRIGAANVIREFVTIHRGTLQGHKETVIGSNCLLMAYVHIAHDCALGDHVIMANASSLSGHVEIGNHAVISGMSGIQQFVRIGEYAFIGAMGGFVRDIPPYMLATGVRGRLHGPNTIGLRRQGFTTDTCRTLKKAYMIIFRSGLKRVEALDKCMADLPNIPELVRLIEFIRSNERGITPAANKEADNGYDND